MIIISNTEGYLGRIVAQRLVRFNHPAAVLSGQPAALRASLAQEVPGLDVRNAGDYSARALRRCLGDATTLLLLSSPGQPQDQHEGALLEAATSLGIPHVMRVGMALARPDASSIMLRGHWQSDQKLANSGLHHTLIHPHLFHQDLFEFAEDVRAGTDILDPTHGAQIPYVDVRDVADAIVGLLTQIVHRGQSHELTGPRAWTLAEVAQLLSYNVGHTLQAVDIDAQPFAEHLMETGHLQHEAQEIAHVMADQVTAPPTDAVSRLTGLPPRALEAFLLDHRSAFNKNASGPPLVDSASRTNTIQPVTWRS